MKRVTFRDMNRQSNLGMMRNPEYDVYVEEKTRWQEFFYRPLFEPVVMYRIPPDDESGGATTQMSGD